MKVEKFKDITIGYMRRVGEYGSENEKLMETFKDFLKENGMLHDELVLLGIALDNPAIVPAKEQRYDVGVILEDNTETILDTRKIDDGNYAIFEVPHTRQGVISFWQNLPQLTAGLSIDYEKPIIERYSMEKVSNHLCEFCIPLK